VINITTNFTHNSEPLALWKWNHLNMKQKR
jgi:hypothetical protein